MGLYPRSIDRGLIEAEASVAGRFWSTSIRDQLIAASLFKPASVSRLVECPGSTNRSRSLSFVSVPLTTDPKIGGLDRP
jgi:hypothetical protein